MKKEKTRMNSVILDWKWKYQCELTVFSRQTAIEGSENRCMDT